MIASLDLTCREQKEAPHPGSIEVLTSSFPRFHATVINFEHGFAAGHTLLRSSLAAEELGEERHSRGAIIHGSTKDSAWLELGDTTCLIYE